MLRKNPGINALHPSLILSEVKSLIILLPLCVLLAVPSSLDAARIKDLTDVRGSRSNQIRGYGIVTGLKRSG